MGAERVCALKPPSRERLSGEDRPHRSRRAIETPLICDGFDDHESTTRGFHVAGSVVFEVEAWMCWLAHFEANGAAFAVLAHRNGDVTCVPPAMQDCIGYQLTDDELGGFDGGMAVENVDDEPTSISRRGRRRIQMNRNGAAGRVLGLVHDRKELPRERRLKPDGSN